jgi:hypothetical protein
MHILASTGPNPASGTELLWHLGAPPSPPTLIEPWLLETGMGAPLEHAATL